MKELFDRLLQAGEHPPARLLERIADLGDDAVPRLIEMATDRDLVWADSDSPQVWAPTHAMRLLGRMRAAQAVEPLIALMDDQEEADWIREEMPAIMAQIGLPAVEPLKAYVADRANNVYGRGTASECLVKLIEARPEIRDDVLSFFGPLLAAYPDEVPDDEVFRGFLIADLLDIRAKELYPEIEAAFLGDRVDEMIVGLDTVQQEWGIRRGAKPRQRADFELRLKCTACGFERPHAVDFVYYDEGTAERQRRGEDVPYNPVVIPQQIVCPKCGAIDRYELGGEAYLKMTAELLKVAAGGIKGGIFGAAEGAERFRLIRFAMQGDRTAHPFEAIDYYRGQIERHPNTAEHHLRLGNVLRFLGRWDAARAEYERALELDPKDASPLAAQADMEVLRGDADRALALFEAYLERTPTRPWDQEDAELWDGAHEAVENLRLQKEGVLGRLTATVKGAAQAVVAPKPSASRRKRKRPLASRSKSPAAPKPKPPSKSQARKKKKTKRKATKKARRGKR